MYLKPLIANDYKGSATDLVPWLHAHRYRVNDIDLTTWMTKHGVHDDDIAEAIGVSRPYVNRVRRGEVKPNLEVAIAIWDFTRREVPIEQLLPRNLRPPLTVTAEPGRGKGRPRITPLEEEVEAA